MRTHETVRALCVEVIREFSLPPPLPLRVFHFNFSRSRIAHLSEYFLLKRILKFACLQEVFGIQVFLDRKNKIIPRICYKWVCDKWWW